MSPWLFNIYMNGVVREVYIKTKGKRVKMTTRDQKEWILRKLLFVGGRVSCEWKKQGYDGKGLHLRWKFR